MIVNIPSMKWNDVEEWIIRYALVRCKGNVSQACKLIEIPRATMYRKLNDYKISVVKVRLGQCDPARACETHGRCWTHSEWEHDEKTKIASGGPITLTPEGFANRRLEIVPTEEKKS